MDTLVEWGRKIPGAKAVIDEVEDRLDRQLFKVGMELNGLNLIPTKEKELLGLTENVYGFTDEEIGRLAKLIQEGRSDLTITPWG